MKKTIDANVVIFGGGVTGLWILNKLVNEGYNPILIEKTRLGDDQTIRSQGMIHGGAKYAFFGDFRLDSAKEVQLMPQRWRKHLSGKLVPDLSGVKVSSDHIYLWIPKEGIFSSLIESAATSIGTRFLAVRPKPTKDVPNFLRLSSSKTYRLDEQVINTKSLLEQLAIPHIDRIIYGNYKEAEIDICEGSPIVKKVIIEDENNELYCLSPEAVVLSAGQGNAFLAKEMGIKEEIMQTRPLRQVIVKGNLPIFYGHCIRRGPYASITTHYDQHDNVVWNIGGRVAENGPKMKEDDLIEKTKQVLSEILPAVDLKETTWSTYDAQRAESKTNDGKRPGGVQLYIRGNVFVGWPTKLALAPVLSDLVETEIRNLNVKRSRGSYIEGSMPRVAYHPWEFWEL